MLVPIATGLALRNVMVTDLPRELAARNIVPVFAVPAPLHAQLAVAPEVVPGELAVLPERRTVRFDVALRGIARDIVRRNHRIATFELKERFWNAQRHRRPLRHFVSPLFGRSWTMYRMLNRLRERRDRADEMQPLIDESRPDVVFANNVFEPRESAVLRRARVAGVPTVGMVHSWDNPTNKGVLPAVTDRLLVWSRVMRQEMRDYYRVPDESIVEVGSPQFDAYARPAAVSRAELLSRWGFPHDARVVMYGTGSPGHGRAEPEYASAMARATDAEDAVREQPLRLVVRLHPRDRAKRYAHLADRPNVVVETPGRTGAGVSDNWNPTTEDFRHFVAVMRHADVVGNMCSTIALDAACNDRPTFHVRYDARPVDDPLRSVEMLFGYTHTQRLLSVGASVVARSPDEIRPAIARCLDRPDELREQRLRLARQEGYDGEGQSAARIADEIAAALR